MKVLVLGDSILWGQGLAEEQKTSTLVCRELGRSLGEPVTIHRFAHSGADVWDDGQRGVIAAMNPDPPPFERPFAVSDEIVRSTRGPARSPAARDASGEVPLEAPYLLHQILDAAEEIPGGDVDLVLVDAGINDTEVYNLVLPFKATESVVLRGGSILSRVRFALDRLGKAFPRAKVVVTGYYPVVSEQTDLDELLPFARRVGKAALEEGLERGRRLLGLGEPEAGLESMSDFQFLDPFGKLRRSLAERCLRWTEAVHGSLRRATSDWDAGRGVGLFVDPAFGPEHAAFAPETLIWRFDQGNPLDPRAAARARWCDERNVRGFDRLIIECASMGHPNPEGAARYADRIVRAIKQADWAFERTPVLEETLLRRPQFGAEGVTATKGSAPVLIGRSAAIALGNAFRERSSDEPESSGLESTAVARRSVTQAEIEAAVERIKEADHGNGVITAPEDALASLLQSFLAEHADLNRDDLLSRNALSEAGSGGLEATFDTHDVKGWVFDYLPSWLAGRLHKRPFLRPSETVKTIPEGARIALLGDWGTGLYGAPACAKSIAAVRPAYDVVMHLGDVYYAGTKDEVQRRFLDLWPTVAGAQNRALNSNHEMYSGGEGYFDLTLKDGRFQQSSSCFAMQTSRLLLLGLDTAYQDHDLSDDQVAWIRRRVDGAGGRKVVLFSHHQPFSQYESGGEKLVAKLGDLLAQRRIFAWYWAHEHRCVFFDRHEDWQMWGRCIGHSGYPAFRDRFKTKPVKTNSDGSFWQRVSQTRWPAADVLDGVNVYVAGEAERYSPNGYVTLVLEGDTIHELVHAADGTVLKTSTIA
ncbi:MAG: metallophosphoesterase [Deltaproteobacteria bacterium]|nr:metallophosphoesterase [Myxococcales bacterium]MDP3221188.1 metallophosphoesterase [Deltaproteobacteria bacterium]